MTRVLVLGDVRLYREGLALIIGDADGLQVVGSAPVHGELVGVLEDVRPDVLLVDAAVVRDGEIWSHLRAIAQGREIIAYGLINEEREAIECVEAGVSGYLPSEATREDLVKAILAVGRGEFHCSARITRLLVRRVTTLASERRGLSVLRALTPREKQVLTLVPRHNVIRLAQKHVSRPSVRRTKLRAWLEAG